MERGERAAGEDGTSRGRGTAGGAAVAAAAVLLAGCTSNMSAVRPMETDPPRPERPTETSKLLRDLPAPQDQVVAAVYGFEDQTGQYEVTPQGGLSYSTAVTQGAASILIEALKESGWFVPIERANVSNLMNERQIIQQIRSQYQPKEGQQRGQMSGGQLPPLLYAGVLLEGGIVGYDTNTITSAAAARYFGAGGSAEFRQDQVTIYLRAVSTQTGRVLKTIHTTKTVLSQQMEAGVFRFVTPNRLLQANVGYSSNEPKVVAVREAIEQAVLGLIVEGVEDGLWSLQDSSQAYHPSFLAYERAKARSTELSQFDQFAGYDRRGTVVGLQVGGQKLQGNLRSPLIRPTGELSIRQMFDPRFGVRLGGTVGQLAAAGGYQSTSASVDLQGVYHFLPTHTVSPFVQAGGGVMAPDLTDERAESGADDVDDYLPYATVAGGLEYMTARGLGLSVAVQNQYALDDGIDGVEGGDFWNDSVWRLTAGLSIYTSRF